MMVIGDGGVMAICSDVAVDDAGGDGGVMAIRSDVAVDAIDDTEGEDSCDDECDH